MYKLEMKIFAGSTTHQFTGGANLISAVLVLAIMILPTVINISEASLRAVPKHLKSASLALGATHIQTIFKVIVPAAHSGIITAVVLGCGRAIGEAMAISLVSGSSVNLPLPFNSVRFPDNRDCGGNVLFRGTSPGSALYHRSGAVRIYHVYQHGAQPDVCEGGRRK